ncbi:Fis family transcriptional regulator [Oceanobacillus oncorhynchi subsp. incaldanensis]|uniref:sigma-54-dependent Fis family transcriptional regulator n=1 Tax=Oceanobacillus oncorhynchi TaxID=545501 RepID=UPI001B2E47E2|nr:sigma-54-dependent transcriptional regulator [Oceanobacillus oncorhynchi]GIO20834.1 Fis family transcriptional regulator [Oceanobacillus oncorhynchi subsp. incaldanensis]
MIKVLVIVPYEGLLEMMKEVSQEVEDIELQVELGNLSEGVAIAKNAENEGYHVIVSRGGTASMIQEAVSIPVIDIQVSGYDVLRILTLVKGFSGKAAIVGFSNITQGAATISELLDLDIKTLTITRDSEVKEKLLELSKDGYEVVIGDVVTVQTAKQLGMTGVLITSGKEAVIDALEETRRSYRLFSRLQQNIAFMETILDSEEQAIGVFNQDNEVIYGNEQFYHEFHWLKLDNTDVKKLIQETTLANEKQVKTLSINNKLWEITTCPIQDATILFFKNAHSPQTITKSEHIDSNVIELHTFVARTPILGKSDVIHHVMDQIEHFGELDGPVWVSGEQGNGKELVVHSIYLKRQTADKPLITLHCDVITAERWKDLMKESFFQKYANSIFFLKNIDKLKPYMQKELLQFLQNENNRNPQWLISSGDNMEKIIKNGTFHRELFQLLAQSHIHIPPLRERREDIEYLVHVFISDLHPKYGNEVVGIRNDALEQLIDYDWPGNVGQLKYVIEQLFLESQSYYIEKTEVDTVFKRVEQQAKQNDVLSYVDMSGTLEEIEKQVIIKVLEEEGMNQSRAAKRLGINRSTLWRKLK